MEFTNKQSKAVAQILERCFDDEKFCRIFKADPKSALEKMAGAKIPEGVQVEAIESTPERWVFVVPSEKVRTAMNAARGVDDQNMGGVTGGTTRGPSVQQMMQNPLWRQQGWWIDSTLDTDFSFY